MRLMESSACRPLLLSVAMDAPWRGPSGRESGAVSKLSKSSERSWRNGARDRNSMSNKIKRIGFGLDPAIQTRKPVLSQIEGSKIENRDGWSRRRFLETVAVAGTGALLELSSYVNAADPPPETTK